MSVLPHCDDVETYIGFDSAWTDKPTAPGAIAAARLKDGALIDFQAPRLVTFSEALNFVERVRRSSDLTILALDQPTIVPNLRGMRPVERVVASLISWAGGGVQPANRGKRGMFCDESPIWSFLSELLAMEDPEETRQATTGLYLLEVFPALSLLSWDDRFCTRLGAPKYNPGRRKTSKHEDFLRVAEVAARRFETLGFNEPAAECRKAGSLNAPRKGDQDKLDALLCLLVAIQWRRLPRSQCLMIGSLAEGYMVTAASPSVRERVIARASQLQVPIA